MSAQSASEHKFAIAIHGGAGAVKNTDAAVLDAARSGLAEALDEGVKILAAGGSSLDAVIAAVVALEENPRFNAGKGSVFTRGGRHELEASIMVSNKKCGGATMLRRVRNPIKLARVVMEDTPHVLMSGKGAEALAVAHGLELVPDNSWFDTEERWEHLQLMLQSEGMSHQDDLSAHQNTVGAVAIDAAGVLVAGTSTGGRTGKWDGRIGDTPLIASGTYASPLVAVSGTGMGEEFIRHAVTHDINARMAYKQLPMEAAVREVIHSGETLQPGDGGVIAVDAHYNVVMDYNSLGMYRACADYLGRREVAIFES